MKNVQVVIKDTNLQVMSNADKNELGSSEYWTNKSRCETIVPLYWTNFHNDGLLGSSGRSSNVDLGSSTYRVDVDKETFEQINHLVLQTWDASKVGIGKYAAGLTHQTIKITRVQRVENFGVFDMYFSQKREFYKRLSSDETFCDLENVCYTGQKIAATGPVLTTSHISESLMVDMDLAYYANEHYLFYGTTGQNAEKIVCNGTDDELCGDKGMFGSGIYFAESATKADQYADDASNRQLKDRKMFMMRVLLGNMFVTARPVKTPPCSNCIEQGWITECCKQTIHTPFDSVVADGAWCYREFVIYRSNQCYPEYLITYDRI